MPTIFRMDRERGFVRAVTRGATSSDDMITNIASLVDHPSFTPGLRVLLDMREVVPSLHRPDVLDIATYVKSQGEKLRDLRLAVVVTRDSSFGMAHEQKAALAGSLMEMEVFRDVGAALEWLGVSEDGDTERTDADAG